MFFIQIRNRYIKIMQISSAKKKTKVPTFSPIRLGCATFTLAKFLFYFFSIFFHRKLRVWHPILSLLLLLIQLLSWFVVTFLTQYFLLATATLCWMLVETAFESTSNDGRKGGGSVDHSKVLWKALCNAMCSSRLHVDILCYQFYMRVFWTFFKFFRIKKNIHVDTLLTWLDSSLIVHHWHWIVFNQFVGKCWLRWTSFHNPPPSSLVKHQK